MIGKVDQNRDNINKKLAKEKGTECFQSKRS
jgi:hypothetical protein